MTRLVQALERLRRTLATAFCFFLFGLGGLMALALLPLFGLFGRDRAASERRVRNAMHHTLRAFVAVMVGCGCISYAVQGQDRLARRGLLVVANHPSLIDVVLLIALLERPNCVIKAALRDSLFTRAPVRLAGFIANEDGAQLVERCLEALDSGDNLIIFPEGTRSVAGQLGAFRRGAAHIALRARKALTPVVIRISQPFLGKGQPWYRTPPVKPHFTLCVHADQAPDLPGDLPETETTGRDARACTENLRTFFIKALENPCKN